MSVATQRERPVALTGCTMLVEPGGKHDCESLLTTPIWDLLTEGG